MIAPGNRNDRIARVVMEHAATESRTEDRVARSIARQWDRLNVIERRAAVAHNAPVILDLTIGVEAATWEATAEAGAEAFQEEGVVAVSGVAVADAEGS